MYNNRRTVFYLSTKWQNPDDNKNDVNIIQLPRIQKTIKNVSVLNSPAVDLVKQLHENKGGKNHGAVLCWTADTRLVVTISHVQEIRKYKHQHKHDGQLKYGVKNHILDDSAWNQGLVATIWLMSQHFIGWGVTC